MTIQDLNNILTIMEEQSINKAAAKLFISQPSLSKCVKKVEQEYGITLFERSRGTSLSLTDEGVLFREIGKNMITQHNLFTHQLELMRARDARNIVLGCTIQRAYDLAGPLMKWIYDRYPGYNMELRTLPSGTLREELIAGNIDMAVLSNIEEDDALYACPLIESHLRIYLRKGSSAAEKATHVEGEPYPVLSLEDLQSEIIVENILGTGGRKSVEALMKKSGVHLSITEQTVYSLRVAMVDAGYATMFTTDDALVRAELYDQNRIYSLPKEQQMVAKTYLVCRKGFQNNRKFAIIREAFEKYYVSRKNK